ncbi:hypothetical protein CB0940_01073 [Cercospora beticola]|uniref:Uncharacterized protein n=1 Tax=Cercospora beticola TaxID=122368 RepID=A0A2G5IAE8_CERBT|nr:hypothetical protein CB0940_01073 [Cercospora beticola]PIB01755.1 hypothetical protein CB0940_01073 [Cercospora beticola]WPA96497.1 hypothetical protein RHO25_001104 [Cercospora beticola]
MACSPSSSTTATSNSIPLPPPLLRLPLELRQHIYSYLLPRENVSHPLPSVGITSVDHRPPSRPLLNIHPALTAEILDYFYSISTWKLVFSHAFNFFRVDPDLRKLEQSSSLRLITKVELVFFCDVLLLQSYPSFGLESFCTEIKRRATRACQVLSNATHLRTVVVSWCDSTNTGRWSQKSDIIAALQVLDTQSPGLRFQIGSVSADDVDEEQFAMALQNVLGVGQRLDTVHRGPDPASELRMLAFDVRQERLKLLSQPGGYPEQRMTRNGWRAAPSSLPPTRE